MSDFIPGWLLSPPGVTFIAVSGHLPVNVYMIWSWHVFTLGRFHPGLQHRYLIQYFERFSLSLLSLPKLFRYAGQLRCFSLLSLRVGNLIGNVCSTVKPLTKISRWNVKPCGNAWSLPLGQATDAWSQRVSAYGRFINWIPSYMYMLLLVCLFFN